MARELYIEIYPAGTDENGKPYEAGIDFLGEFEGTQDFTAFMIREENSHRIPQNVRRLPLYGVPTDMRQRIELLRDNAPARITFLDKYDSKLKDDGTLKEQEAMQSKKRVWEIAKAEAAAKKNATAKTQTAPAPQQDVKPT